MVPAEVSGEVQKRGVLFAHAIENADSADLLAGLFLERRFGRRSSRFSEQPEDFAPRASQLSLQRLDQFDRRVKVLLEEMLENLHELWMPQFATFRLRMLLEDIIEGRR